MTDRDPLLIRKPTGWGWGPFYGSGDPTICCVVARALGEPVEDFVGMAKETALGRELNGPEFAAIVHADDGRATDKDREIILWLAEKMMVEP